MSEKDDEAQVIADEQAAEEREQVREAEIDVRNEVLEETAAALETQFGWQAMQHCVCIRALKR